MGRAEDRRRYYLANREKFGVAPDAPYRRKRGSFNRADAASLSDYQRLWRYGLTREGYEALWDRQGGRCGGCNVPLDGLERSPDVDHDHSCCPGGKSCGKCVRGLLCRSCNNVLGRSGDNSGVLRRLAQYLEQ